MTRVLRACWMAVWFAVALTGSSLVQSAGPENLSFKLADASGTLGPSFC